VNIVSSIPLALLVGTTALTGQADVARRNAGPPEVFSANAQVKAAGGAGAATLLMQIERYTPDADRTVVESALKQGGYAAFLNALRKAPQVGQVQLGDQKIAIRWARQTETPAGRTIVLVTDQPLFFVGGGAANAKPRTGYDVALIQMTVDTIGLGSGTMAAAARVRPGGDAGVQVDDYADAPIKLVTVSRQLK
jgi:hypothetical protein